MLTRLLAAFLRPYRRSLLAIVLLQLLGTIAALFLPSLNARIIDDGIAKGDTGYIVRVGAIMLAVSVVQIVCSVAAVYLGARAAMSFGRDVRQAVFDRVGRFGAQEMARFGAPSLITRNTNDVQQVQMLVVLSATMMVAAPIMCVGGIIMALRENLRLSWLVAVSVPVLVVAIGLIIRRMVPQFRAMQERIDSVNRVLREQISGVRVVRAFVREPVEQARFGQANDELTDTAVRAGRLMARIFPSVMAVLNISIVAVLWFGSSLIDAGHMQVGSLTAFMSYLMQILMSVMMATFMLMMVPRAAVCAERIQEVLDVEPAVAPPARPQRAPEPRGVVEFRHVDFRYPGAAAPVLHDISFRAEPGTTTAIVGSTGSGKSTLISLIPRLFDVTAGEVLVDGVDVREFAPDALWRRIGIVPQHGYLFSGTVASNLRYVDAGGGADDAQLWQALEIAQARDFVAAMPGGLEASIAQGGTNLSGGQRQRLAIARALVRRAPVLLLDDAFSALDVATDARVRAALRPVISESTLIVVASRVATIAGFDQIVVLDAGTVVGVGRHDELLERCPTYAEIVTSQLSADEAA